MIFREKRKYIKGLEHTALTDIVFILLIFFLLTSSYVTHTGIKVDLPEAKDNQPLIKQDIVVSMTKNVIFVNEERVEKDKLFDVLEKKISNNKDKLVIIKSDQDIALKEIVAVIETAKLAGAIQFAIATKEK